MMGTGADVFSDIAGRYDRINRILSLGRDRAWRRRALEFLPQGRVLDLGAGTGAANLDMGERTVIAVDPSLPMLSRNTNPYRVAAVGEQLPLEESVLDGAFSAFVFRNLTSVADTLQEIHRVLRPGGVAVIVGLTRPMGKTKQRLHRMASAVFVPLVGRLAGAPAEYKYLNASLDKLPPPELMFVDGPLRVEKTWRMGPLGFVYGAVLKKT